MSAPSQAESNAPQPAHPGEKTGFRQNLKNMAKSGGRRLLQDVEHMFEKRGLSTLKYLSTTEVHTYAFSVAANFILAFFPFMVLLMTLTHYIFHSPAMTNVVKELLRDFLPTGQEFIVRNIDAMVNARRGVQLASLVMLLITSSGVFLPLEVALNRVWGIAKNRSYLGNQLISVFLACIVGLLALFSVGATAGMQTPLNALFSNDGSAAARMASFVIMKVFGVVASMGLFFFIYWLLPNGKIPARAVLPVAITAGVVWELSKYLYIYLLPWLDFKDVYGPFAISVTLMFWAYISGMLLLAGAHLSAVPENGGPADPV